MSNRIIMKGPNSGIITKVLRSKARNKERTYKNSEGKRARIDPQTEEDHEEHATISSWGRGRGRPTGMSLYEKYETIIIHDEETYHEWEGLYDCVYSETLFKGWWKNNNKPTQNNKALVPLEPFVPCHNCLKNTVEEESDC